MSENHTEKPNWKRLWLRLFLTSMSHLMLVVLLNIAFYTLAPRFLALERPATIRYLVIANLLATIPLLFGASFIKRLYQFDSFSIALGYLTQVIFQDVEVIPDEKLLPPNFQSGFSGIRLALVDKDSGKLKLAGDRPSNRTIAWAGGPGYVLVPPNFALQLEKGGRFGRIVGPGLVRLGRFETIYKVLDLRQIIRSRSFTAFTRDGIPVTTEATVHCQLIRPKKQVSPTKEPLTFDPAAVRATVVKAIVPIPWTERVIGFIGDALNEKLGYYRLDQLFDDSQKPSIRTKLQDDIKDFLEPFGPGSGLEVVDLRLGDFELPKQVTDQHIDKWRAYWQSQAEQKLAEGDAAAIDVLERARAQALQEIIEALVQAIHIAKRNSEIATKKIIMLQMLDRLERLGSQGNLAEGQVNMPMLTRRRLGFARRALEDPGESGDD